jgi:DNA primase
MPYVDFAELKAKVSITDVFGMLGIDLQRFKTHGDQLRGTCPIHGGDNPRGFVVTPGKGLWYCFSGCGGGDIIKLVSKMRKLTPKEAAELIAERFGNSTVPRNSTAPPGGNRTVPQNEKGALKPLDYLQPEHDHVQALGVSPETAAAWETGYAPKGIMRGRYAVPLKTKDGNLVAYVGIAIAEEQSPRLHFPNGFDPQIIIFGADRVEAGGLTLVRDPLQAIIAAQNGVENVIAFLTPTISAQQLEQLASLMDEKSCEGVEVF